MTASANEVSEKWLRQHRDGINRWREAASAKAANYGDYKPTPDERIERTKALYVAGEIDHFAFEMSVNAALGLPLIVLGTRFSPGVSGEPLGSAT